MKKIKNLRKAFLLCLVLVVVFAGSTCKNNIALGSAVDINRPEVTVTSPPLKATIRNSFTLKGEVKDDGVVNSVTVSLKHRTVNKPIGPYKANIDKSNGTWSIVLNRKDDDKFPIIDGDYEVFVLVEDASGKSSQVAHIITIDNTAPLLIINRPSTIGLDEKGNAGAADVYGDAIWIEGEVADTAGVEGLEVYAYGKDDKKFKKIAEEKNIPPTVQLKIDAFSKGKIDGFYKTLYGKEKDAGEKSFYCAMRLWDTAKEYDSPDSDGNPDRGNVADNYYLYAPLYNNIVFPNYTTTKIYYMMTGLYSLDPGTGNIDSAKAAEAKKILDGFKTGKFTGTSSFKVTLPTKSKDSVVDAKTIGFFGLNPILNPTYEVIGSEVVNTLQVSQVEGIEQSQGSKISLKLTPNLDGTPIVDKVEEIKDKLKFYFFEYTDYLALDKNFDINNTKDKDIVNIHKGIRVMPTGGKIAGGSLIVPIELSKDKFYVGKKYVLLIKGKDKAGNAFLADSRGKNSIGADLQYGFTVVGTGKAPTLKVVKIVGSDYDYGDGTDNITEQIFVNDKDIKFKVVVSSETYPVELKYSLKSKYADAEPIDLKASDVVAGEIKKDITISSTIANTIVAGKSGVYTLFVTATNKDNKLKIERTYTIYYDVDGPQCNINRPALSVTEMPVIKGNINDMGVGIDFDKTTAFTASYKYNDGAEKSMTFKTKAADWELEPIASAKEGKYEITIKAKDKLGNAMTDKVFKFVYDKAKPKINSINTISRTEIENGKEISSNSSDVTISGVIEETNGIKKVEITVGAGSPSDAAFTSSGSLFNFSKDITGLTEGKHSVKVSVTDKAGKIDSLTVDVVVDTKKPVFKTMKIGDNDTTDFSSTPIPTEYTVSSSTVKIIGTFEDTGSGLDRVVATYTKGSLVNETIVAKYTSGSIYEINGALDLGIGEKDVTFTAYDKSGKTAEWPTKIKVVTSSVSVALNATATNKIAKDGNVHVNGAFTINATGTSSSVVPLDFSVTRNGKTYTQDNTFVLKDLFGITCTQTPTQPPVTFNEDNIVGLKTSATPSQIVFTPKSGADGRYVFKLYSGTVATTQVVVVDTEGPAITPVSPQEGINIVAGETEFKMALFDISDIADGTSAVNKPDIKWQKLDDDGNLATGTLVSKSVASPYSCVAMDASSSEGTYKVWFTARDKLGNESSTETTPIKVFFDKDAPSSTLKTKKSGDTGYSANTEIIVNAGFDIEGTGSDTHGIKSMKLEAKLASAANFGAAIKETGKNITTLSYTVDISKAPFNNTDGTYDVRFTVTDKADRTVVKGIKVIVDRVKPTIDVTTVLPEWIASSFVEIKGSASDADSGIDRVEYSVDNKVSWKPVSVTANTTNPLLKDWNANVSFGTDNIYFRAVDKAGNICAEKKIDVSYDMTLPKIELQKVQGISYTGMAYWNKDNKLKIDYSVKDDESGVAADSVKIVIEKDGAKVYENLSCSNSGIEIAHADITNNTGVMAVKLSTKDKVNNKSAVVTLSLIVDKEPPTAKITNFEESTSQTGIIDVKGIISDVGDANVNKDETKYLFVKKVDGEPLVNATGWLALDAYTVATWEIKNLDLSSYFTPSGPSSYTSEYATETSAGSGLYNLPLYLLVKDNAGNAKVQKLNIVVDPAGDRPSVEIMAPISPINVDTTKAKAVGGKVSVYGNASVKVGSVGKVYMDVSTDPSFTTFVNGWTHKEITGSANWNTVLNEDGEIDDLITGSATTKIIYYRVYAKNGQTPYAVGGYSTVQMLKFDTGVPVIEDAKLYKKNSDGSYTPKDYKLRQWVKGDDDYLELKIRDESGIGNIQLSGAINVSLEGKTQIESYTTDGVVFTAGTAHGGYNDYTAKIPIKTLALSGDEYSITIIVKEGTSTGSSFLTQSATYTFRFDNTKPLGAQGQYIAEGNSVFANTSIPVDIDKAKVGFKLFVNEKIVDIVEDGSPSTLKLSESITGNYDWVLFTEAEYLSGANAILRGVSYDDGGSGVKKIIGSIWKGSSEELTFTVDNESSERIKNRLGNYSIWDTTLDVSALEDGEYTLKFKVRDGAYNESDLIERTVYVKNNPIRITRVWLGTDLNKNGSIKQESGSESNEELSYVGKNEVRNERTFDYSAEINATDFTFKDKDKGHIRVEYQDGNGDVLYSVKKGSVVITAGTLDISSNIIALSNAEITKLGQGEIELNLVLTDKTGWSSSEKITVNVNTQDSIAPISYILPFYWNNNEKNSLVWGKNKKQKRYSLGHIEFGGYEGAGGTYSDRPAVSGRVLVEGYAYDETLLKTLTFTAGNLEVASSFDKNTVNSWTQDTGANDGVSVKVETVRLDQTGHFVHWELAWDTSKITGVADYNITVKAVAQDEGTETQNANNAGTLISGTGVRITNNKIVISTDNSAIMPGQVVRLFTTGSKNQAYYTEIDSKNEKELTLRDAIDESITDYEIYTSDNNKQKVVVDVVPYISHIVTPLAEKRKADLSELGRSALGKYSLISGDTIKVYGFNLTGATVDTGIELTAPTETGTINLSYVEQTPAASGPITVTTHSVESINNKNRKDGDVVGLWNNEANGKNHLLVGDDREVRVFTNTKVVTNDSTIRNPAMDVKANGTVGWAYDKGESTFMMTAKLSSNGTPSVFMTNPTRFYATAFAYDSEGNTFGIGSGGDITSGGSGASQWSSVHICWNREGSNSGNGGYKSGTYRSRFTSITSDRTEANTNSDRVQSPALATKRESNRTYVYLSYYDAVTKEVKLRKGLYKDITPSSMSEALSERGGSASGRDTDNSKLETKGAVIIASGTNAGKYTDVVLAGDNVVVAWFDFEDQALKIKYGSSTFTPSTTGVTTHTMQELTIDSGSVGEYSSMVSDGSNLHFAYYDSNSGDLKYAYLPWDSTNSKYKLEDIKIVVVDSFSTVGTWTDIAVAGGVPYISYMIDPLIESNASIKLAYPVNNNGVAQAITASNIKNGADVSDDSYTQNWEIMNVPASAGVKRAKLNIGIKDSKPIVGYATNNTLEYTNWQ